MLTKKPKKKGPLRTGAIFPTILLFAFICTYTTLFFDGHLKRGLEWAGTRIHGAEVNIGDIQTDWTGGSLLLTQLQITDRKEPSRNLIQIEKIHFQFLWDALLRTKFVIDKAIIENVQVFTPREKPGYILLKEDDRNTVTRVKKALLNQTKDQFDKNVLADIAHALDDSPRQLKDFKLKSDARAKELEEAFKEKKNLWNQQLKDLPKEEQGIRDKIKDIRFDKDPLKALNEADKLYRKSRQVIKSYDRTYRGMKGEIKDFKTSLKELEGLAKEDLKSLQKRFQIPNIHGETLIIGLFGYLLQENMGAIQEYMKMGRQYLPPKKTAKQPEISPPPRGQGRNIPFKVTTGYPLFWLKQGRLSSTSSEPASGGRLSGEIRDLTSDPSSVGRPTTIILKGDFPKQQIVGLDAKITIDHRADQPSETIEVNIASYPIRRQKLSDSKDLQLTVSEAQGSASISAVLRGEEVNIQIMNSFKDFNHDIKAKSKSVEDILTNILGDIPHIYVESQITGRWSDLSWKLNSNLGKSLSDAFRKELRIKMKEAQIKLKEHISDKLKTHKKKIMGDLHKTKDQLTREFSKKRAELEKWSIKNKDGKSQKRIKEKINEKLKREGQKALKKLFGP